MRLALFTGFAAFVAVTALLSVTPHDSHAAESNAKSAKAKHSETGLASFYSRRLEGKETASGETFRNEELVAAHPRHPFGTRVRVTNLENGASVVVRITDRGASAGNRKEGVIIDLSQAAATQLKMKKDGRVQVRAEVLEWGEGDHKPLPDAPKKRPQK